LAALQPRGDGYAKERDRREGMRGEESKGGCKKDLMRGALNIPLLRVNTTDTCCNSYKPQTH